MRIRSTPKLGPAILTIGLSLAACRPSPTGPIPEANVEAVERAPRVSLYGRDVPDGLTARPERDWTVPGESLLEEQPRELAQVGQARRVDLALFVDPGGRVRSVEVVKSSGARAVDERAAEIAASWRFSPARKGAVPVSAWVDDAWVEWPLIIVDGVLRPDILPDELGRLDILHVDICKGSRCGLFFGAPWARSGIIDITTRAGR
jgi:TonB family protein